MYKYEASLQVDAEIQPTNVREKWKYERSGVY